MAEVKPNLDIWISGYFYQLSTLSARTENLEKVFGTVQETLDGIKEELALINNGNKTLIEYFNSEIKKEKEDDITTNK